MITVLNTATSELLASLADVKEALSITDNVTDETLTRFIARASRRIAMYCGRQFLLQRYQVFVPSYGGVTLQLPHREIRTLFSLFDSSDTGSTMLTNTGYRLDSVRGQIARDEGFPWSAQFSQDLTGDPAVGAEYPRWLLDYSAGFIPSGGKESTWDGTTSTSSTVPPDLTDAVIGLVQRSWLGRGRDLSIQSERVGELSVSYHNSLQGASQGSSLPSDVTDLLAPYRSLI